MVSVVVSSKTPDGSALFLQYYKINDTQFIETFPNLKPETQTRVTHVAFYTDDIEKLRKIMEDRGLKVGPINMGRDGNKSCGVRNPPGQRVGFIEFVQYLPGSLHANSKGKDMSDKRLSAHLRHTGVLVTDRDAALKFYDALGFKEVWRGSPEGNEKIQWIHMQVPGSSGDYVELVNRPMPVTWEQAGLAEHISLDVPDIQVAYKSAGDRGAALRAQPQIGQDKKWQFSLVDPDGTRVEFQQPLQQPGAQQQRPQQGARPQAARQPVRSVVTIYNIADGTNKVVYTAEGFYQAPNWSPDGKYLLLNSPGKLWRLWLDSGKIEPVDTGSVKSINNDHGISWDGKWLAISAGNIYVLPSTGGEPRQVTEQIPSYFHGFSPNGKWLAYCAKRGDNFDIYRISVNGGAEQRLTMNPGYDDGPEYSPDGKWIYFNSNRAGTWDIWRMPAEGAGPNDARAERITSDELEDWFPHLSPDGKSMVFVSFESGIPDHPANKNVVLRMMRAPGDKAGKPEIREIVKLFGGQGTINVNSWAPDSKRFAYVSYELLEK